MPAKRADCKRIAMERMLAADMPLKGTNISRVDAEAERQRSQTIASKAKRADCEQNELELADCKQSELGLADASNARL